MDTALLDDEVIMCWKDSDNNRWQRGRKRCDGHELMLLLDSASQLKNCEKGFLKSSANYKY